MDSLEHVVKQVFESCDGSPDIDGVYHALLSEIMQDYHGARAAALAGAEGVREYSRAVMLAAITDVSSIEGQGIADADAKSYMQTVEHCCAQFDADQRTGPLREMLSQALQ